MTEAINFFVSAFEFGLLNAMMGVRKMLALIFSRETTIQVLFVLLKINNWNFNFMIRCSLWGFFIDKLLNLTSTEHFIGLSIIKPYKNELLVIIKFHKIFRKPLSTPTRSSTSTPLCRRPMQMQSGFNFNTLITVINSFKFFKFFKFFRYTFNFL